MARSSREQGGILVACSRPVDGQAAIVEIYGQILAAIECICPVSSFRLGIVLVFKI